MSKAKTTLAIAIGALAGIAAGILSAPKSGKETRKDIKDASVKAKDTALTEADKLKTTVVNDAHKAKEVASKKVHEATDKAEELKSRGLQAFEAAKDGLNKGSK